MNNNRVREIQKEDKKAFKGFTIMMIVAGIIGFGTGFMSVSLKDVLVDSVPSFFINLLQTIVPFGSIVLSIALIIIYKVIYTSSRKEYDLWKQRGDDEETVIDKIEEKLSYVILFSSVNTILGYFFFGAGLAVLSIDESNVKFSVIKGLCFFIGFILCIVVCISIQKKLVNFEKEINPLLKGSVYDMKFTEKWVDSCDEALKLGIYKSAFKSHSAVSLTCIILWVFCVIGRSIWNFGIMPLVMVTIIWLVQTIFYCVESIKCSKNKMN
ncbi:MAG: DUF3169 family protein [Clostridium sp.]|nr:DUF3169 family protein [Clostridium sp.]